MGVLGGVMGESQPIDARQWCEFFDRHQSGAFSFVGNPAGSSAGVR